MTAQTLEALPEYELGMYEDESGHDGEYEAEFFSTLAGLARRAAQNPTLRRVGLTAARQAAAAIPAVAGSIGKPGSFWSDLGSGLGTTLSKQLLSRIPQQEWELEGEFEINPIAKVYPAAVMEHLGRAAAEAEDAAHAEAFIGALVPLGLSLARAAAPAIARATPQLIKGAANVTRMLRSDPATAPLVRAVPSIVRGAAMNLARQSAAGRPPSPQAAARALANQTARTLTNPGQCVRAYRRSQALDRRYHQAIGR
jgi:hypothetical protein